MLNTNAKGRFTPMPRGALHHGQGALYTMANCLGLWKAARPGQQWKLECSRSAPWRNPWPAPVKPEADSLTQLNLTVKSLRCQWPGPAAGGRGMPQPATPRLSGPGLPCLNFGTSDQPARRAGKLESLVEAASDSPRPSELPAGLGASVTVTQLSLPAARSCPTGPGPGPDAAAAARLSRPA